MKFAHAIAFFVLGFQTLPTLAQPSQQYLDEPVSDPSVPHAGPAPAVAASGFLPSTGFRPFPSQADLAIIANRVLGESFTKVPYDSSETRHQENKRLNAEPVLKSTTKRGGECTYEGQDTIIIALEGTGAFQSRMAPLMQDITSELTRLGYDVRDPAYKPYETAREAMKGVIGRDPLWSGLGAGPLSTLLKTPGVAGSFRSYSFPSEETEALSSTDAIWNVSADSLTDEFIDSNSATSKGIDAAHSCIMELFHQAAQQKKQPKLVIMTHSSGGRSAVKLIDQLQTRPDLRYPIDPATRRLPHIKVDLLFTIDPVKEAHEAVKDAAREVVNKGTEYNLNALGSLLAIPPKHVYPPTVNEISQPSSLYRSSSVKRHINLYQRSDSEGLKMEPKFGILGAQMSGADENIQIFAADGIGAAAHGEIAYVPKTTQKFIQELMRMRGSP